MRSCVPRLAGALARARQALLRYGSLLGVFGVALAVVVYALWEWAHRGAFLYSTSVYPIDDADEWRYTACSRLVVHGYGMFTEVFSAQPPLLFLSLAAGMRAISDSIDGARAVELAFGLVGLLATAWVAREIAGPLAGGSAALVLAVSPAFLVYSRAVEAEGPMMALATVALGFALAHRRHPVLILAALAGLALAAASLIKLFAVAVFVPALWAILARPDGRRDLRAALVMILCGALPVLAEFLLVAPSQQWDQVVAMHSRAASIALPGATPPFDVLRQFFELDLGLSVLAAAGLLSLVLLTRWWDAAFLGLWVIGSLTMLAAFRPLFPHHPVILTSSLAVAAGVGAAVCLRSLQTVQPSLLLPAVLGALVYVTLLPRLLHDDRHVLYAGENPRIPPLVAFVERRTAANAMVATDDLAVADEAQRLVPPPLCDPSNVRLRSGYLSAATLIDATRRYHATVVLPTFGIYQQVPQYMDWVRRHYRAETARSGETAYIRK